MNERVQSIAASLARDESDETFAELSPSAKATMLEFLMGARAATP